MHAQATPYYYRAPHPPLRIAAPQWHSIRSRSLHSALTDPARSPAIDVTRHVLTFIVAPLNNYINLSLLHVENTFINIVTQYLNYWFSYKVSKKLSKVHQNKVMLREKKTKYYEMWKMFTHLIGRCQPMIVLRSLCLTLRGKREVCELKFGALSICSDKIRFFGV